MISWPMNIWLKNLEKHCIAWIQIKQWGRIDSVPLFMRAFGTCVVKTYWKRQATKSRLDQCYFSPQLNNTDNPLSMKDLRSISLCNVIYKVILKVVARRLQPFLIKYISIAQAAFVENISILDNVMDVMETIHYIRCNTRGWCKT